jgi:hypothetical protein
VPGSSNVLCEISTDCVAKTVNEDQLFVDRAEAWNAKLNLGDL